MSRGRIGTRHATTGAAWAVHRSHLRLVPRLLARERLDARLPLLRRLGPQRALDSIVVGRLLLGARTHQLRLLERLLHPATLGLDEPRRVHLALQPRRPPLLHRQLLLHIDELLLLLREQRVRPRRLLVQRAQVLALHLVRLEQIGQLARRLLPARLEQRDL